RPDGDGLQVRIRGREPAGGGDGLVEGRVQAAVLADQRRQRAEVRVDQLRQLAPLLDRRDDLVRGADRAQDARVRGAGGLAFATGGQLELFEQAGGDVVGGAEAGLRTCMVRRRGLP